MSDSGTATRRMGIGCAWVIALGMTLSTSAQESLSERQRSIQKIQAAEESAKTEARAAMARFRARAAAESPAVAEIEKALDERTVTLDLDQAPFETVRRQLDDVAGCVLHNGSVPRAAWNAPVTLHVKGVTVRRALESILAQVGLDYTYVRHDLDLVPSPASDNLPLRDVIWNGVVSLPSWEGGASGDEDERIRKMLDETVVLEERDWRLTDALSSIGTRLGIKVLIAPESNARIGEITVSQLRGGRSLYAFLAWIGPPLSVGFAIRDGVLIVIALEDMTILTEDEPRSPEAAWKNLTSLDGRNGVEEFRDETTGIVFVKVPAGEFGMGSAEDEPGRAPHEGRRRVRIERPFLISKTEVTNEQFSRFAARRRYLPTHSSGDWNGVRLDTNEQPAVRLSWLDVYGFCRWSGFRLPTEEEWEYVARGGDERMFPWGSAWPPPLGAANLADGFVTWKLSESGLGCIPGYLDNGTATMSVGESRANRYGVQDMSGNVWEWCGGRLPREVMVGEPSVAFQAMADSKPVLRGGGWTDSRPSLLRCASRMAVREDECSPAVGLRVALDCPPGSALESGTDPSAAPPSFDLERLIELVSAELKLRVLYDEGIRGRRTGVASLTDVKREDLLGVLLLNMGVHGYTLVKSGPPEAEVWKVVRLTWRLTPQDTREVPIVGLDELDRLPDGAAAAELIVLLRHVESQSAAAAVRDLVSNPEAVRTMYNAETLHVTDAVERLHQIADALRKLDVPESATVRGLVSGPEAVPMRYAEILFVTDTVERLRQVAEALRKLDVPQSAKEAESLNVETGLFEVSPSALERFGVRGPGSAEGSPLDHVDADALWSNLVAAAGTDDVRELHRWSGRILDGVPMRTAVSGSSFHVRLSLLPRLQGPSQAEGTDAAPPPVKGEGEVSLGVGLGFSSTGEAKPENSQQETTLAGEEGAWLVWAIDAGEQGESVHLFFARASR